jgi:hypothetical protein
MTPPNYDHATLFVAPRSAPGTEAARGPRPAADDGAEAMRRLRHPFAVRTVSPRSGSSIACGPAVERTARARGGLDRA